MENKELRKKLFGRSVGSLFIQGTAQRAIPENIIDHSVYQNDMALYIPEEDWKH
ncbi:hypothetical protein [Anaerotignum propionicum]|uniref:hypothetical protein n=1 Tax=Anaerotignum propionicum TaxID=28446 RepID=UPI00289E6DAE|nr:hypothetical protein [Anaerotignum propionicum]